MRILPHLNVHLDHSLSNEGGAKKCPKGNQEVPAGDSSQVKQGVWNAEKVENRVKKRLIKEGRPCSCQDAKEADPLHQLLDAILGSLKPEE